MSEKSMYRYTLVHNILSIVAILSFAVCLFGCIISIPESVGYACGMSFFFITLFLLGAEAFVDGILTSCNDEEDYGDD